MVGLFIGVVFPVGASIPALWEATQISPAIATRPNSFDRQTTLFSKRWVGVGLVCIVLAIFLSLAPAIGQLPLLGYLATLFIVLGLAALMPWALQSSLILILPWFRKSFGEAGALACTNLLGRLGKASIAISSLMVGIAMMLSLSVMIHSFRETVYTWIEQTLRADLWVQSAVREQSRYYGLLSQETIDYIKMHPAVESVDDYLETPILFEGKPAILGAGNFDVFNVYGRAQFTNGQRFQDIYPLLKSDPFHSVIISEVLANKHQLKENQRFWLTTPSGKQPFKIVGIYYDYANAQGICLMDKAAYRKYFKSKQISGLAVYLKSGSNPEQIRQSWLQSGLSLKGLNMRTHQQLRQEIIRIFNQTFAITYALHGIAVVVALLCVLNTMLAIVMESKRDFGILKYLGATKHHIQKLVIIEAGIVGFFGFVSGLMAGMGLSWILVYVINKQSFGWSIQWHTPYVFFLESFVLIMITAILAGIIPAKLAAKTQASQVLRAE